MPSATATDAPAEEPPGIRRRSRGLPGVPKCGLTPIPAKTRTRAHVGLGALVGSPATSKKILDADDDPSRGPSEPPRAARASLASADARAVSPYTVRQA